VPGQFYEQALLPTAQQIVQGKSTGEQAGELAAKVAQEWRDFNPDMVDHYKKWATDLWLIARERGALGEALRPGRFFVDLDRQCPIPPG
jgi:hypothetical protein